MEINGKIVVITGASGGLGKALAKIFVREKAIVVVSSNSGEELKNSAVETGAVPFVADVTKESNMDNLAEFAVEKFGRIDIWINNAGITGPHSEIEEIDMKEAHKVMEVNLFGTVYGSRAAMRFMKKQKSGAIVNIVSASALAGRPRSAIYSSSKWAARGFTEALKLALEPKGVSVIAVYPGGIKTGLFGERKPVEYDTYMEPEYVAGKIIENLKLENPEKDLIIKSENY
ncbi:MAG: SDR family oxidoreductase [Patescibacteria group bacterium]